MVANRPSSDDCSGWYRPNRIEFHEMTKSKKGTISKGQMEFNFRIEHTDPVVHQINDVTCIHFFTVYSKTSLQTVRIIILHTNLRSFSMIRLKIK